jgi:hypothetical protein
VWFLDPVDPDALGIPEYREKVPFPMDLGTVSRKLAKGMYGPNLTAFASDVRLVFRNAVTFSPETDAPVHKVRRTDQPTHPPTHPPTHLPQL